MTAVIVLPGLAAILDTESCKKPMKRNHIAVYAAVAACAFSLPLASMAQPTTVFNDTFASGSTAQSASPASPTANSTAYQYFQQGGAPATPTIASGDLHLAGRTTSSSISEVQALFTTTPVTLTTVGDWIDLTVVFTDTQNILVGGVASSLNLGLYNSGGSMPTQGVRLDSTGSGTGGAVGWTGYNTRILGTGVASTFTRAPQGPGLTNPNQSQDLLFNGASGSSTYNNPAGLQVGSTTATTFTGGLTQGSTYTLDYQISLSAANTLIISNSLYNGSSVAGSPFYSQIVTASGTTYLTNSFDGFALGWRYNSTSAANSIDVSSINISGSIQPAPEPGTLALMGGGAVLAVAFRHRLKRG